MCFSMMDEDGDGAIDADELRVAFAALGIDATHAQCVAEIRRVDRDRGKGTILFPEFVALVIGEPNAASGRDGPRSRLSGRERAARRLAAGADADSDARVVLAEANVGPEGQGMERALAEARASETDPRIARNSATTSAADESRAPVLPNRGGSFRLNLLAFKRRTSIERVAHAPSRVRVLAREDARAAAAAARAEAALISAVAARRRAGTFVPGDERLLAKTSATATSKSEVRVGAETEIADVHGETHPIGTHLLESSGDEAEEDAASLVPPPGSVFVDAR